MEQLLRNARVVTVRGILDPGWVEIADGVIAAVGTGQRSGGIDLEGRILTPGFVDAHVHGAAGSTFGVDGTERSRQVAHHPLHHGTTTLLAGLRAAPPGRLADAVGALRPLIDEDTVAGILIEGPFLSPAHGGAQNRAALQIPTSDAVAAVRAAVPPHAASRDRMPPTAKPQRPECEHGPAPAPRLITIAPELPGAIDAIRELRAAGWVVAVGHTDANYDEFVAAFDAGATVVTHLFNAMRPIDHRDPGPVIATRDDPRAMGELIADGFHLGDRVINFAFHTLGADRVTLITDAMEATGRGDGRYPRGDRTIVVSGGKATLADSGGLAGSTLTLAAAVRRVVRHAGIALPDAVRAASFNPAKVLHLDSELGSIAAGMRADFNAFTDGLELTATMRGGAWVTGPWMAPTSAERAR
jgi:N-acetylglucosamine-6-phosphate deacetylase